MTTPNMLTPGFVPPAISVFARMFNIPAITTDILRWNQEWEKHLPFFSSSQDVYPIMCQMWRRDQWQPAALREGIQSLQKKICDLQALVARTWQEMEENGHFVLGWLILEEEERRRHLLNGLQMACQQSSYGQDSRALCPEITVSAFLRQGGVAFKDFLCTYATNIKKAGENKMYMHPSQWWQMVMARPKPWPEEARFAYALLTMQRNEFITGFLFHTTMSIVNDLALGSPDIGAVTDFMKDLEAGRVDKLCLLHSHKPPIRCENCVKTPQEMGENRKFMVCGSCKSKLDFDVSYCSQACQKADWPSHKRHCGKQKYSKALRGTVNDPIWQIHPSRVPDEVRNKLPPLPAPSDDGDVDLNLIGFGNPDPLHPRSPALQRQLSLLMADKSAEYFLFDDQGRPIRFEAHDAWTKMGFRFLRDFAFSDEPSLQGAEAMAEYLIKVMGRKPGLTRQRILSQFSKEYGGNMASKMAAFQRRSGHGHRNGTTFLEMMSKNLPRRIMVNFASGL